MSSLIDRFDTTMPWVGTKASKQRLGVREVKATVTLSETRFYPPLVQFACYLGKTGFQNTGKIFVYTFGFRSSKYHK